MGIFKKLTKGLKEKIVDPFKGFVNRNKKALVTAAGQGIGRSTAELFRENGAEVYV